MPKWKVHVKIGEKYGIRKEVTEFVNKLLDFPQIYLARYFPEFAEHFTHAKAHKNEWIIDLVKRVAYEKYGEEGIKAVELHLMLDKILI